MKPPAENKVEVDMVPLIDIISLLLMFLIIVGDTAANAENVQMQLPRSDMAKTEKELLEKEHHNFDGRIVIQMKKDNNRYLAVVNNKAYELVQNGLNKPLLEFLNTTVDFAVGKHYATKESDGSVSSPVKLRIPADAPMKDVQRVIMTCAQVGLVHVQYAADPVKR